MNAREYTAPTLELVQFDVEDVIATSEPEVTVVPALEDDVF
jgi:hypothetical protein